MSQTLRTFVAIDVTPEIRRAAERLISRLADPAAKVRWVEPSGMHLTLCFLGDVEAERIPEVCRAVERAAAEHEPFAIEVRGAGAFPTPQRPRTLWLGLSEGVEATRALHASLQRELDALGFPRESRQLQPHVTIGRVRQGRGELPQRIENEADFPAGRTSVSEVVVYSSQLGPDGSTYTPLGRAPLGKPA